MNVRDVLQKCADMGHPMKQMGLYIAGKKYGFIEKDGRNYVFHKEQFYEWINKAIIEPPKGWVRLKEIPSICDISLAQTYILVKSEQIETRKFGAGQGVSYVDPERFKEAIAEREKRHRIQW